MNIQETLQKVMIGAQLRNIEYAKSGDTILRLTGKNNFQFSITLTKDDGDCCGYADLETNMLISRKEIKNNPVITNVIYTNNEGETSDSFTLTIYGINKKIFKASGECSSGSGWAYGACINLHCKKKNLNINLAEY